VSYRKQVIDRCEREKTLQVKMIFLKCVELLKWGEKGEKREKREKEKEKRKVGRQGVDRILHLALCAR
jgi:hypothetical protein